MCRLVDSFSSLDLRWHGFVAALRALHLGEANEQELFAVCLLSGMLRQLSERVISVPGRQPTKLSCLRRRYGRRAHSPLSMSTSW